MSSKEKILNTLKESLKNREAVEHPVVPMFEKEGADLLSIFKKTLETAFGTWHEVSSIEEAQEIMRKQLPDAKVFCSSTDEWQGNKDLASVQHPQELEDVDLGIFRAQFGVAETGGVWITDKDLKVNSLGCLSENLAVLLDPKEITENMHTAYKRINIPTDHYGLFMMGPSSTGDIEATIIQGAQGARTLTLFFI